MKIDFITGFAEKSGLSKNEAKQAWADWSRQMGDVERAEIERAGHAHGIIEGERYAEWSSTPNKTDQNETD